MKVKKYLGIALSIGLAICATGCGEKFPELTDQQYAQTVEYAAGLLMKHSNNGQERLVYVDAAALEKQRAKEAAAAAEAAEEVKQEQPKPAQPAPVQPEPEKVDENPEEGQALTTGDEPVAETPEATEATEEATEGGEGTGEGAGAGDPNAITLSDEDSQEITDDIFLSYQGYMVASTYPESSKSYFVNADKGKKLLVLRFDLYNGSDSAKAVNIIPLHPQFEIIFNGKNIGYSSVTVLPNDLSTYSGTIDSRAHESVVVLTQISADDSKNIQSLGMIVTLQGQSQTVNLK